MSSENYKPFAADEYFKKRMKASLREFKDITGLFDVID